MDKVDCIIAGAGVVGLAIARALARRGIEVLVLEPEEAFGTGTSSRNSEVIHAGIYYPTGSLKAQLCVEGKARLYAYARAFDVPHRRCGKLIVATDAAQVAALEGIRARAEAAGVTDLRLLSEAEARAMEPELACKAALLSPSTGIVDSHALMLSLLGQAEQAGALLSLGTRVAGVRATGQGFEVTSEDAASGERFTLACGRFVNAAGCMPPSSPPVSRGWTRRRCRGRAMRVAIILPCPGGRRSRA